MDEKLKQLAGEIRNSEYEELFPETPVEKAKEDEEKIKEALFQVHHMVYNKQLHQEVRDKSEKHQLTVPEIKELCGSEKQFERVQKLLKGATLTMNDDGETLVPKTDLRDVLSTRKGLMD